MYDYAKDTHAHGVWAVAPLMGIDLARAIREGHLSVAGMSGMLRNCAECWSTRHCAAWWLAGGETRIGPFCRNAQILNGVSERFETLDIR